MPTIPSILSNDTKTADSSDNLISMLDTLLDHTMAFDEKNELLAKKHELTMTAEICREVLDMCNLNSGIEKRSRAIEFADGQAIGFADGEKHDILQTLKSLVSKGRMTAGEAAEEAGMTIYEFNAYKLDITQA